ncbi:AAA family ATPase [Moraxella nasovis]|uniref:AAA family ATPase n=1 Tax=Moraxella nasovis TaxID=2904121 RepID=UPI001F609A74|nr:AAA family ATPase [Moraxella nasovis]UNU73599.1 AAA family ATPase [Moraxella nasovis]
MKILNLSLQNINSLKGKWCIDFTDEAFNRDGIFAIVGQTGAGKTTIFDAICLAIFGKTPRINKISTAQNDLMSVAAAECSSQVELQIGNKLHRFYWSQRRARGKADGKLQAIEREISSISHPFDNNGKIIETKPNLCDKLAVDILHMNFEQFTRSVMLAQGEFSAFLKANANERGEILEKIAGTQIYSQISQKTFEIHKQKNENLTALKNKLSGSQMMSQEHFENLQQTIKNTEQALLTNQTKINDIEQNIKLIFDKNSLQEKIDTAQDNIHHFSQKLHDFAPDLARLQQANLAYSITPLYQKINDSIAQKNHTKQNINALKDNLPALQEQLADAKNSQQQAQLDFDTKQNEQQTALPVFRQVRNLDSTLYHLKINLQSLNTEKTNHQHQIDDYQKAIDKFHNKLNADKEQLATLNNKSDHHTDNFGNDLGGDLGMLSGLNHQFSLHTNQLIKIGQNIQENAQKIKAFGILINNKREDYKTVNHTLKQTKQQFDKSCDEFCQLFALDRQAFDISKINHYGSSLQNDKNKCVRSIECFEQHQKLTQKLSATHEQIKTHQDKQSSLLSTQKNLTINIENINKKLAKKNDYLNTLKHNDELTKELTLLKQKFDALKNGEPCPLCGSLDHPYKSSLDNVHHYDNKDHKAKITAIEQEITKLSDEVQQHNNELIGINKDLSHCNDEQHKLQKQRDDYQQEISDIISYINQLLQKFDIVVCADNCDDIQQTIAQKERQLSDQEQHYLDYQDKLIKLNSKLSQLSNEESMIKNQGISLKEQLNLLNQNHQTYNKEKDEITLTIDNTINDINGYLSKYQQTAVEVSYNNHQSLQACFDIACQTLSERITHLTYLHQEYQSLVQQKEQLTKAINENTLHLDNQQERLNNAKANLEKICQQIAELDDKYQSTIKERQTLFGEKNVDDEEQQLQKSLAECKQRLDEATQAFYTASSELVKQKDKLDYHQNTLKQIEQTLTISQDEFYHALTEKSFKDKDDFIQAILPKDVMDELAATHQHLTIHLQNNEEQLKAESEKLEQLIKTNPSLKSLNLQTLQADKMLLQHQNNDLSEDNGKNKTILANEQSVRQQNKELTQKIIRYENDIKIWEQLNALIGSSDGNKYRNFVQGLTLELMLHHANEILGEMSKRYVLVHGDDKGNKSTLDISVIDTAQGGEMRSTQNLSGGESFIVSLALAMGLSKMSSDDVQIDSLFLDEGFGTLDDEILDVALTALSGLYDSGKLIGIISHVNALKERIGTKIYVKKTSGGASELDGAGVSRLTC